MLITVTTRHLRYDEDCDGEPTVLRDHSQEMEFATAAELADWMAKNHIDQPSDGPEYQHNLWWAAETYPHPEDYNEERALHRGEDVSDDDWRQVWLRLRDEPEAVLIDTVAQRVARPEYTHAVFTAVLHALACELDEYDELRDAVLAIGLVMPTQRITRRVKAMRAKPWEVVRALVAGVPRGARRAGRPNPADLPTMAVAMLRALVADLRGIDPMRLVIEGTETPYDLA